MSIYRAITLGVLVLFLSNCQQAPAGPQPLTEADKEQITALRDSYQEAYNAKDLDALLALYTDDAYELPANAEMVQGMEAIQKSYEGNFEQLKSEEFAVAAVETSGVDGLAYEVGTFTQKVILPGSSEPVSVNGKYVVVVKKQADGSWKLAVGISNLDQPPAAPGKE